jgi:hypothetical protein
MIDFVYLNRLYDFPYKFPNQIANNPIVIEQTILDFINDINNDTNKAVINTYMKFRKDYN